MDTWLFELLNRRLAGPLWDGAALALTTVGLFLLPALALPLWRRRRPLALALLFSQGLGLFLGLVLQELIARPRPPGARLLLGQPSTGSFPSGHAVLAVAAATVLWASDLPRRWRLTVAFLAAGVAASRVAVGHHWPSDVLAGALLGLGVGLGAHGLLARGERGLRRYRWLLWPQAALVAVVSLAAWLGLLTAGVPLPLSDKACHFLLFGGIAFWLALGWEDPGRAPARGPQGLPLAVLVPFGLALAEEALQGISPVRTFDLVDLGCDLAGMVLGWGVARGLWRVARPTRVALRDRSVHPEATPCSPSSSPPPSPTPPPTRVASSPPSPSWTRPSTSPTR
jgi:undecaprenyl-diphosphatase